MGCCFDKQESARLKEEVDFDMPKERLKRGYGEHSHDSAPKRSRGYQETTYKIPVSDYDRMVADLENSKSRIAEITNSANGKIKERDREIHKLKREITSLQQEKDALLTRVSQIAGANLLNNNPNIADLNDSNRPTKLAEYYSELYDNEWTDAFAELEDKGATVQGAVDTLRNLMTDIYKLCDETASRQRKVLDSSLRQFTKNEDVSVEMIKQLKENRKANYKDFLPELNEAVNKKLTAKYKDIINMGKVEEYKIRALELCWLMCIQDPPVHMDCEPSLHGQGFDKEKYKFYTTTGPLVDFAVWPPLYIKKGGHMLCKGTAQGLGQSYIAKK